MFGLKKAVLPLMVILALAVTGCSSSKKKGKSGSSASGPTGEDVVLELNADSDSGKAGGLSTVYFNYNSATLTSMAKDALSNNADFLKSNDDVEVQIEGHCDERGGVQYNLALGEKRARRVKEYLVARGVSSSRISTISFGKERPVSFGHDEDSWSKNRRGNFVITAK